ncbi:bifunctional diaminohydroxyphosphoribosylaminopyrimidine deaminase/5-amino-6-(5-phosphoribosylamino)uracil reductase RibD [Anaeromyxobacter oryzisoli]|uniref:bifunctional diaminohydroxyphosphoribosylaminopyrimidine deaminase/5-amino-6-(5-phosphoribosylamino)uracil reductase RibD n=1 Tax=Anaeromyxobacter oryzisoli TaxID=2925408 RepID=UPI001F57EC85|nr:bifunctional diaminohydroxyphosphoribosylaminopyrimidine deaminase/5-amino-6-(5-phosphoribosylamino)uracil reductase RibD [Anaeromyxobacter sp. SG63]
MTRTLARAGRSRPASARRRAVRDALFDQTVAEFFMRLAVREAQKGLGRTSPNPAVGAVLVKNGRVIARGHHARAGGPHAEVVALRAAGGLARGADLYTTLEPCDHQGKTPPCSLAILAAGVRRVFVGSRDPNPLVNGRGVARLERGGITVVRDVLRDACDRVNAHWFTWITEGRPHVTLKAAVTLDGRIATRTGDARWVTGEAARAWVHRLRDRVDAVLVGAGTARADDPELTTRLPGGRGHDPVRVVLDTDLELPARLKLFHPRSAAPTLVAHASSRARRFGPGVELLRCRRARGGGVELRDLLAKLAARGVTHVLVEGGAHVHASFLEAGLVDRVAVIVAPKLAGADGLPLVARRGPARMADALRLSGVQVERLGDDVLVAGVPAAEGRRGALAKKAGRG